MEAKKINSGEERGKGGSKRKKNINMEQFENRLKLLRVFDIWLKLCE